MSTSTVKTYGAPGVRVVVVGKARVRVADSAVAVPAQLPRKVLFSQTEAPKASPPCRVMVRVVGGVAGARKCPRRSTEPVLKP